MCTEHFAALLLARLHSVGGPNGRRCLSSSVGIVCNAVHMQRNSLRGSTRRASRVTSRYSNTLLL